MSMILPHVARGPEGRPPIVFLHGFAGDRETWMGQMIPLETRHRVIAFDLPGHGAALDWPKIGHAGLTAEAVTSSLAALGHDRFHLVGHSMGGAVATIIAFKLAATGEVASLTLVSPGGFGPEIDARLLRRFALATEEAEIEALYERFFAYEAAIAPAAVKRIAESRADPTVGTTLARVAEAILDGERQKSFDLARLADLPHPIRLIWGEQDRVLPVRQSEAVPGVVAVHRFPGVGHMPHLEVPREVTRLVAESAASA
jgi:pyruvate dehydrogenase E2 component (dihydrolipoamide acetyltransferase)